MPIIINLDSHENMTLAEKFTVPLRGVLGGREIAILRSPILVGNPHTQGFSIVDAPDKAIFEVWQRVLLGIILFTVASPYTIIAAVVLVAPPIYTAVAEYFSSQSDLEKVVEISDEELKKPVREDAKVKDSSSSSEESKKSSKEQKKVKTQEESRSLSVEEEIRSFSSKEENVSSSNKESKKSLSKEDVKSKNSSTEEESKEVKTEILKKDSAIKIEDRERLTPSRVYIGESRRLTDIDLQAINFLENSSREKTMEKMEQHFQLKIRTCNKILTDKEFLTLRKSLVDILRHPTIIRVENDTMCLMCLAIPALKGANSEEMNEKAAIFIMFDVIEGKPTNTCGQLLWSCQQGVVCQREIVGAIIEEQSLEGNIFPQLLKNEAVTVDGYIYQRMIEEDDESTSSEENSLSASETNSSEGIDFTTIFGEASKPGASLDERDNSISESDESQETELPSSEKNNYRLSTSSEEGDNSVSKSEEEQDKEILSQK
ncbi:MAG: hypothetical protein H0T62_04545 [Parachlamydiaceae bacterium]|nr:hypothetical protein [Parachlamydiaceae bacterium]